MHSLWEIENSDARGKYFGIAELDALLPAAPPPPTLAARQRQPGQSPTHAHPHQQSDDLWSPPENANNPSPSTTRHLQANQQHAAITQPSQLAGTPILELISPPQTHNPSSSGKTSLIYLITALAILPQSLSNIHLGGHDAAIIVFDPLAHFNIARLATVMVSYIKQQIHNYSGIEEEYGVNEQLKEEMTNCVRRALQHVHIFRPQSWDSLLSTLSHLPSYLFSPSKHKSTDRRIHSLILEDIDAFYWNIRNSNSSSSFSSDSNATKTNSDTLLLGGAGQPTGTAKISPLTAASNHLTTHIQFLRDLFSCAVLLTSHSTSPAVFRPSIPTSWAGARASATNAPVTKTVGAPQTTSTRTPASASAPAPPPMTVTRLAVKRVDVVPFAPGLSISQAEHERAPRWDVVSRGRFECWRVGGGSQRGWREDEGFVFRVLACGVVVGREE